MFNNLVTQNNLIIAVVIIAGIFLWRESKDARALFIKQLMSKYEIAGIYITAVGGYMLPILLWQIICRLDSNMMQFSYLHPPVGDPGNQFVAVFYLGVIVICIVAAMFLLYCGYFAWGLILNPHPKRKTHQQET